MRHRKSFNHLGRKPAHRKAMLSNMAASLIMNKRITTTVAKAKELRSYVEPLMTKSKNDTTHSRRVVFSYLQDKYAVNELFREISPKIATREGGYTRILKIGNRPGDNAEMAIIELVDYNENMLSQKPAKSTSKRRRRGGSKSSAPAAEVKDVIVEETAETAATEATASESTKAETEVAEAPVEDVKEEETSTPEVKNEESKEAAEPKTEKEDKSEEDKKES